MFPHLSPYGKRNTGLQQHLALFALLLGLVFLVKLPSESTKTPVDTGFVHYLEQFGPTLLPDRNPNQKRGLSEADEHDLPWYALSATPATNVVPVAEHVIAALSVLDIPHHPVRFSLPILRAPPAAMSV